MAETQVLELDSDYLCVILPPECSPEHRLWAHVVARAVDDLGSRSERVRGEALAWFLSEYAAVNSFAGICLLFGWDVEATRRAILQGVGIDYGNTYVQSEEETEEGGEGRAGAHAPYGERTLPPSHTQATA